MNSVFRAQTLWADADVWPLPRKSPMLIVLGGINASEIVDAALTHSGVTNVAVVRFEPDAAPPCNATLWRLETATGEGLNSPSLIGRTWHRPPYALTIRLVSYAPGSSVPVVLDEGTIGTRVPRTLFMRSIERLAMRFVQDGVRGYSRGPAGLPPAGLVSGLPGWVDRLGTRWRDRLMSEWWSLGTSDTTFDSLLQGRGLRSIHWFNQNSGGRYLADPFPWLGTDKILCEEMPMTGGIGRIVAVSAQGGQLTPPAPISLTAPAEIPLTAPAEISLTAPAPMLDDGCHHSYPCTFEDDGTVYCVPESTERGATRIYELDADGSLVPVCDVAPHLRLADPTLFRRGGRYWIACTDLDLGGHDNLCLLHAPVLDGPWTPHAKWPVRIDVRGARCAGPVVHLGERLFRPGQDCAATYGAGIAIHEIVTISQTDYRETLVTVLKPERKGPFPHGLHTLAHDGQRFWVDGKRFVFDVHVIGRKVAARAARAFSVGRS